jgi:hypothetical protein
MTAADAVVFFSSQTKHALDGVTRKTGLNINMHGRPNNLGASFLNNSGIEHSSQVCVSGTPEEVCDQLRYLQWQGMRFNIATSLFEAHEAPDPGEIAGLIHDLTPGGVTFLADYAMDGLTDREIDALTTSDVERKMKKDKGNEKWRKIHGRFSALDVDKWMTEAGFGWMRTLPLAAQRVFGIGIGGELAKSWEYKAAPSAKAGILEETEEELIVACW